MGLITVGYVTCDSLYRLQVNGMTLQEKDEFVALLNQATCQCLHEAGGFERIWTGEHPIGQKSLRLWYQRVKQFVPY